MQNKGNTRIINLLLVSVGEKESQQMTPKREVWLSNPSLFLHLISPTKPAIVILVAVMHDLHRHREEGSQGNDTRDLLTKEGHKQQTKGITRDKNNEEDDFQGEDKYPSKIVPSLLSVSVSLDRKTFRPVFGCFVSNFSL